jgi:hypothetical protein
VQGVGSAGGIIYERTEAESVISGTLLTHPEKVKSVWIPIIRRQKKQLLAATRIEQ